MFKVLVPSYGSANSQYGVRHVMSEFQERAEKASKPVRQALRRNRSGLNEIFD